MDYPTLPGLTPDGTLYRHPDSGMLQALIPPGPYATAHAPALAQLPDGSMLCAWFAGSFEGSADISVVVARKPAGAPRWEQPVKVSRDPARSEQNPSFFLAPDGEVWLVYTAQLDRVEGKTNMQYTSVIRRQRSRDGGASWSGPELLIGREGSFCRQPIQVLSGGRWIFANWLCFDDASSNASDYTVFQISDDRGGSWRAVTMPESRGCVHANVVELAPGRLAAFLRSRAADFIYRSESRDGGESWSAPVPTPLPNNNSSISAVKLQSGRVAIAYNPTRAPDPVRGTAAWPGLRCPVAVALSEDGGLTWPLRRIMEAGEGFCGPENATNNHQYEYPFLMQGGDGMLHLAFAWQSRRGIKQMSFGEEAVCGDRREAGGVYNPTAGQL